MNDASSEGQWVHDAVDQYERQLTAYAAHLLRDPERARDVVQETFCRLCRQKRADVDGHLAEWLFTVCRNCALDVLRKERRMKPLSDLALETRRGSEPDPGHEAEQSDAMTAVLRAIGTLPKNQQEVVRLKFHHGLSYRQISRVTELSVTNVGFLLHTAIKTLRHHLTADGPAPGAPARP